MQRVETNYPAPHLPRPKERAYFPEVTFEDKVLKEEVLRRAGENLLYAIQYGSFMTGDATPTSMIDMILIVDDTKKFHERNKSVAAGDYGAPRLVSWHNWLNRFGFNFYHSQIQTEDGPRKTKYAVISESNFIRGCNGTVEEKERERIGAFGFYVAGRMQKAALKPFFKTENSEKTMEIEKAINSARVDGVWLSLGLLPEKFTFDELLKTYVSLSYIADLRIERPGKIQTMIDKNRKDYEAMLQPILKDFEAAIFIAKSYDGKWRKLDSPTDVKKRLLSIKRKTIPINYIKNPIVVGIDKAVIYAVEKAKRIVDSHKRQ